MIADFDNVRYTVYDVRQQVIWRIILLS